MISPSAWRITALGILTCLLVAKFFVLGPTTQLDKQVIDKRTADLLGAISVVPVQQKRQPLRGDLQEYQFQTSDCTQPYVALQSIITEDPVALVAAAKPLPLNLEPHVIYLGRELNLKDRLGLKLVSIEKFVSYRLGLSAEHPASIMYILLAAPECTGYRAIDWSRIWAA